MSITNKKIDALRRLLLGNLYQECKDNPMGVSRARLEAHLEKMKEEGCIGDCSVDEFVKTCQLQSHYPTCVSGEYRGCIEGIGERSRGVDKFYYNQYKNAKMIENEPDDEEEELGEGFTCNVCGLDGDDDIGLPVERMSCGHYSHINCLIKIAQEKGRDNGECPECRRQFSLEEVPVPVRTLEQRQADSFRRALFNSSQMGLDARRPQNGEESEEEETEEDILSNSIVQNIREHQIDEAIEEIRDLYRRDIRRTIISMYIRKWFNALISEVEIGQIDLNDIKRIIDVIFESNTIISPNNRLIIRMYNDDEVNENIKELFLYIIKAFTNHYIRHHDDNNTLGYFLQILMANNTISFLEEVIRTVEREGVNDSLRDAFNVALEDIDFTRIEDRTREVIIDWFNSHNYQAPSFESDVAQQLTDAIIEHIENRYFMGAEAGIEEFYEREFEDSERYIKEWIIYLLDAINSGELENDNVVSLVDIMFPRNRIISLDREQLKKMRNIMRLGGVQTNQCIYIVMRVSLILIKDFPDEENLGILVENIIKAKALTLLKVVMKVADDNDGVEVLKRHLLDIIGDITDTQPKNVINQWFRSHNFPLPRYRGEESEDEEINASRRLNFDEDDRPLQISRVTPPHERVRGGWFNRIRK